jgi:hypothetical protein
MNQSSRIVNQDEVISINKDDNVLMPHHTYKVREFLDRLGHHIDKHKIDRWMVDGVPCELLSPCQGWQQGKIKICLQFIPDKPESILDDVRKEISND